MRKFTIGIVSLAIVIGVFVFYSRIDKTPPIETNSDRYFNGSPYHDNINEFNDVSGKVTTSQGDLGVGPVDEFIIYDRNEQTGEVLQKSGFLKLLHKEGDIWQVEKPFVDIYGKEFICYMRANRGDARMEKIGEKTIPKNATFSDNVVINILPKKKNHFEKSTISLDNLYFNSERSQLLTNDKIVFDSNSVHLNGTGMEMVYNDELGRLEYFKVIEVNEIHVKMRRKALGTISSKDDLPKDADTNNSEKIQESVSEDDSSETIESNQESYTCIFSKNVLIKTPDQFIFAEDEIEIKDIIFSGKKEDVNEPEKSVSQSEPNDITLVANGPNDVIITAAEPNEMEIEEGDFVDVVITCDNGFIIAPDDSIELRKFREEAKSISVIEKPEFSDSGNKTILSTQKIQLTTLGSDYAATGPTELVFYIEDLNNPDPNLQSFPVTITSQSGARFIEDVNLVAFEEDAVCTIPQNDLSEKKYATLTSPMLLINIPESEDDLPDVNAIGPVELLFYVEDTNATIETQKIIPVKITAQEKALYLPAKNKVVFKEDCLCQIGSEQVSKEQFISLKTPNLQIDLPEDTTTQSFAFADINATGPVDLKFFMKDPNNKGTLQSLMPVNISAQKYARYLSSSRQIVLDGSCKNSMVREDEDFFQELTLLAGRITVDLPDDINDQEQSSTLTEIRHLKADSDQVILTVKKKAKNPEIQKQTDEEILGWTQLVCKSLDYDTQEQIFKATGPGELTLSDIEIKDSIESGGMKILGKKWWAIMSGFNDLTYLLSDNRIIANAEPQKTIDIKYIEQENDERSPVIIATAGHIEIELKENEEKKLEPSIIIASGGIYYKKNEDDSFRGSVLLYDHEQSTVTIYGNEKNPAYYNSVPVDDVFIDMATGEIKSNITSPGSI
ncbi:MAG: hypothetical protein JXA96_12130 [Sedimentisphaerales bacterium]|nr:hypothetical protein [Sedimentisphaerales bacterium]